MATFKQTLVEPDDTATATGGKGKRNDSNIRASFPGSPIYAGTLDDDLVINQGTQALNGAQTDAIPADYDVGMDATNLGEIIDSGAYYGGSSINLNYNAEGGPIVAGQTEDDDGNSFNSGGGTPTNPYVPALASNGTAGATEPSDLPNYGGDLSEMSKLTTGTKQWGSGDGHNLDPSVSSVAISGQTIGNYTKGSSS
jgi:hypothetical protein